MKPFPNNPVKISPSDSFGQTEWLPTTNDSPAGSLGFKLHAALLCVLFASEQSLVFATEPLLEVFVNDSQEPKAWRDEWGIKGYVVETAEAIFIDAGINYVFTGVPFPRAIAETKACKGAMLGVFESSERRQYFDYSKPIVADRVGLVTKADRSFPLRNKADLIGRRVSYLADGIIGLSPTEMALLKSDPQTKSERMLQKLMLDRTDVVILSPREQIPIAARTAGIPMSKLKMEEWSLASMDNHIVFCKSWAYKEPIARINRSIVKLKADGTFDRIMLKYQGK